MNIVITGSLGNISKPLTQMLVQKGQSVTVVTSKAERQPTIEDMGAKAAIGSMNDAAFLQHTFEGADIVYAMEAVGFTSFFDHNLDVLEAIKQMARSYKTAIMNAGVQKVVHLSSIGAHTPAHSGILKFHYYAEQILNELPAEVAIKFMRPVGFYNNMFAFVKTIKEQNAIIANYGGDDKEPWVSPVDIAAAIAEEMELPFAGRTVRYVASEELSPNEVAATLGAAVGKSDVKWLEVSDEQALNGLLAAGMNPQTAKGYMEMNAARRGGVLYEDYNRHRPVLGRVKLAEFAKAFTVAYHADGNNNNH